MSDETVREWKEPAGIPGVERHGRRLRRREQRRRQLPTCDCRDRAAPVTSYRSQARTMASMVPSRLSFS